jgi:alkanesulfonate monooxygenase SsuD/methylene tetrahydromethanopterin reductase-like flavin-dependent oxidoreductase (luciferase family)
MKCDLFISTQFNADQDLRSAMCCMAEEAEVAQDPGFESIWCPHHYVTDPMRMFQPHEVLARLSAELPGFCIGTVILLLSMINPLQVAELAAILDWTTNGGYILAVGLGYRTEEFQSMGVERKHRLSKFIKAIEVIRRLWTKERATQHGQYFHLESARMPHLDGRRGPASGRTCRAYGRCLARKFHDRSRRNARIVRHISGGSAPWQRAGDADLPRIFPRRIGYVRVG